MLKFSAKQIHGLHLAVIVFGLGHLISIMTQTGHKTINQAFREVSPNWPEDVPATFPTAPPPLIQVNLSSADVPDWGDAFPHKTAQVYLGEPPRPYVPSMFHTLHCLHTFLGVFNNTMPTIGMLRAMHLTHCLNYVRQMILCQADASLEELAHPEDRHGTPGDRKCRDWNTVLNSIEEHYQLWLRGRGNSQGS